MKVYVSFVALSLAFATLVGAVVESDKSARPAGKEHRLPAAAKRTAPDAAEGTAEGTADDNFLSVDHQLAGFCMAGSKIADSSALGGFGPSNNYPRPVNVKQREEQPRDSGGLYLLAQPQVSTKLAPSQGMRVVLVNRTEDLLRFAAADSRISVLQEAVNPQGKWTAIEHMPACFCGNSFHHVFLPSNHYWSFAAPRYQGEFKTKLRFTLTLADGSQVHSNVFAGSVNPQQFVSPPSPFDPPAPKPAPPLNEP